MGSLTPALKLILDTVAVDPKFTEWLAREGLVDVEDVALICATEEALDTKFLAVAKAAGVPLESLSSQVKVKKVWAKCKAAMQAAGKSVSSTQEDDSAALPDLVQNP